MTAPNDSYHALDPDQARQDLREGIASSREILRQSRLLIELAQSGVESAGAEDDDYPVAN